MSDPAEILRRAAASEHGLALTVPNVWTARALRRSLYGTRDRLRRHGATEFDGLSVVIRPLRGSAECEVLIVRRDKIPRAGPNFSYPERPLSARELPREVRARGPCRSTSLPIPSFFAPVPSHQVGDKAAVGRKGR